MPKWNREGFTLVELLVVISIISLLMAILMPALAAARSQGHIIVCMSNLRQLVIANISYAGQNDGSYAPAAADIRTYNNQRWHGRREDRNQPFDPSKGPLSAYFGNGEVKKCPAKVNFRHGDPWEWDFEDGCGGYGYNMTYIGSRIWRRYNQENCRVTAKDFEVKQPTQTVMFADAAMAKLDNGQPYYLEYSFVEPPYFLINGKLAKDWGYASPSIHFRHRKKANVGWVDGHIDAREMMDVDEINAYGVKSADMNLGWFESLDNSLFDLR